MNEAGSLKYSTKLDTDGFSSGLNKMGSLAKGISTGIVASVAAIGAGITAIVKSSIDAYADYEQLVGGVESMFGGLEKGAKQINKVKETAKKAWKDLTMSQNDYYTMFNSTYPLMKNDIKDQNAAIDQTNRLLKLESDLSNTFGYSMEQATTAVNWALKGTFSYIDNLNIGIKGTQEGFLEAAHKVGYMVDSVSELSSSDILDILEKTADQYGVLGKTAQEAQKTIQGSLKMTKAAWKNMLTGIADDNSNFEELMDDMITSVGALFKNLLPRIEISLQSIAKLIPMVGDILIEHAPELQDTVTNIVQSLLDSITNNIEPITKTAMLLISNFVKFVLDNFPKILQLGIDIIVELVNGISQEADELIPKIVNVIFESIMVLTNEENLRKLTDAGIAILIALCKGIIKSIPELIKNIDALLFIIKNILGGGVEMLKKIGLSLLKALIDGIIGEIPNLKKKIPEIISAIKEKLEEGISKIKDVGKQLIKGLWQGMKEKWSELKGDVEDLGNGIVNKFKSVFGIKSPSRVFRDVIGKNLILGIGVSFDKDAKLINDDIQEFSNGIVNKMQDAVNVEAGKMSFSGTTGSVNQILSANSSFTGNLNNVLTLDGEVVYENQQKVSMRKNLQYGGK